MISPLTTEVEKGECSCGGGLSLSHFLLLCIFDKKVEAILDAKSLLASLMEDKEVHKPVSENSEY